MTRVPRALLLVLLAHGIAPPALAADTPESLHKKASAVLARLEGEIKAPGLKEPVEVLRDRWGIPHIYANAMSQREDVDVNEILFRPTRQGL
jgi:acyl-homoserine lactone acylase PvdQ